MKRFIITENKNDVWFADSDRVFHFRKSKKGCTACDLYSDCVKTSTDETPFPFPCTERSDKKQGVFIDSEKILQAKALRIATLSITALIAGILTYFELIPNFIEKLIYLLWG